MLIARPDPRLCLFGAMQQAACQISDQGAGLGPLPRGMQLKRILTNDKRKLSWYDLANLDAFALEEPSRPTSGCALPAMPCKIAARDKQAASPSPRR
jgi:hypothetical protein